jgi:quinol monooxygenase YgiN
MKDQHNMIIISGTISIPADKRAACLEASIPMQMATRTDEPGCLAYVFSADPCDAEAITVYELWQDAPTLAAHFLHQNYFNMRDMFGRHGITGAVTRKYRIDADAPVYNADRIATVEFD